MRRPAKFRDAISRAALAALAVAGAAAILVWTLSDHGSPSARRHGRQTAYGSPLASRHPRVQHGGGPAGPPREATLHGLPVRVSIDLGHPGTAVPSDFLGLSFEALAAPRLAAYARSGELVQLLRSLGAGILRLGGESADAQVAWSANGAVPRWASGTVSAPDLAGLATLAGQTGWKLLLTVNLGHFDPAAAAQETAAAHSLLGAKLAGIEIGNEPDRYFHKGLRGPNWSFSAYRSQFDAYRSAIARETPGVPIAGPDASSGEQVLPWLRESATLHPDLLTDHYYPLSSCGYTPVVSELLSPVVRGDESAMLSSLGAIQRASATPLQLDESNNISCKGQPGVSNTFASALWAADYAVRAMASGIRGLDFHDLINRPGAYSPLVEAGKRLHANPEWYALLLTQRLQGTKPLPTTVQGSPNLTARAFLTSAGALRLMLVNFDPAGETPLLVRLRLSRRFAGGSILRLTAPSLGATSHVKLGGGEVSASGAWSARLPLPSVGEARGSPELEMPPSSAAMVTLEGATARD